MKADRGLLWSIKFYHTTIAYSEATKKTLGEKYMKILVDSRKKKTSAYIYLQFFVANKFAT